MGLVRVLDAPVPLPRNRGGEILDDVDFLFRGVLDVDEDGFLVGPHGVQKDRIAHLRLDIQVPLLDGYLSGCTSEHRGNREHDQKSYSQVADTRSLHGATSLYWDLLEENKLGPVSGINKSIRQSHPIPPCFRHVEGAGKEDRPSARRRETSDDTG